MPAVASQGTVHSFGHFYSAPSSPLLLRGAPDYNTDTVLEFHAEVHRQLQIKDLPKVPAWRLERESNSRPSGRKASSQPRRHHVPRTLGLQTLILVYRHLVYYDFPCRNRSGVMKRIFNQLKLD